MKKTALLFLFAFGLLNCKSKTEAVEPPKTTLQYLTGSLQKQWKVTQGKVKVNGAEIDLIANQPPCITDNLITLSNSYNYELLEGATKCDPKNPDSIVKATWKLVESPKSITLDKFVFLGYTITNPVFEITSINDTTFVGKTTIMYNNVAYAAEITFSAV
jgi:hypothetical protein